ncbi:MAG TPA: CaiB/BaiF CoA-transferase family protein [Candidatus Caenarcaniphilales bacterium]|nr:CaiB/BaiF CoA-transferase family protein [Candidatus Caenarcaniphilales bacterium]
MAAIIEATNAYDRPVEEAPAEGPLSGLVVADCSTVLAGPYCTMVLADLGAEVIKIEPLEGDSTRGWGPPWVEAAGDTPARVAAYFLAVNRNKRSVRLDLRRAEGGDVLRRLLAKADVLVENFRPGGFERLGFDDRALDRINPRLVHLAITGYGPDGPDAPRPGYDFVAQAVGGLMSITGFPDDEGGRPTKVGVAISDIVTGLFGAVSVLAALRTGNAQRVDVSLLESTLALLINQGQNAFATGTPPVRRGNAHPNIVPYETFETADAEIAVAAASERQWLRLCRVLGLESLAADPRFADNDARVRNREALRRILAERFVTLPAAEWLARLESAEVPSGRVNDVLTAVEQPQSRARQMDVAVEHPLLGRIRQLGMPYKLSASPATIRSAPPLLGEHTDEVLAELGYDAASITQLHAQGVV